MKKTVMFAIAALFVLNIVGSSLADKPKGPVPQPPKCVPAVDPGCSDHDGPDRDKGLGND